MDQSGRRSGQGHPDQRNEKAAVPRRSIQRIQLHDPGRARHVECALVLEWSHQLWLGWRDQQHRDPAAIATARVKFLVLYEKKDDRFLWFVGEGLRPAKLHEELDPLF